MSTAPLLSRAEASGPAPSFPHRHRPQSTPQAHPRPPSTRTTTAPTRGPSHIARQLPRPRSFRPPPQPRPARTATAFSFYYKPAAIAQPPGATGGTAPAPRRPGAVVRAPQLHLAFGRGTRRTGTTAPKSLRGGKAVDGHPQRRPCRGSCRGCAGGKRRRDPLRSQGCSWLRRRPAARGGFQVLLLVALCGGLLGQRRSAAGARLRSPVCFGCGDS